MRWSTQSGMSSLTCGAALNVAGVARYTVGRAEHGGVMLPENEVQIQETAPGLGI